MASPRIRHIALFARNPLKLAKFYADAFDMKIMYSLPNGTSLLSDGYLTLAILAHNMKGQAPIGINHFGFQVDDRDEVCRRLVAAGGDEPVERPSDRPYAELRAMDLEGNWFDISKHGYEEIETASTRQQKKPITSKP